MSWNQNATVEIATTGNIRQVLENPRFRSVGEVLGENGKYLGVDVLSDPNEHGILRAKILLGDGAGREILVHKDEVLKVGNTPGSAENPDDRGESMFTMLRRLAGRPVEARPIVLEARTTQNTVLELEKTDDKQGFGIGGYACVVDSDPGKAAETLKSLIASLVFGGKITIREGKKGGWVAEIKQLRLTRRQDEASVI